MWHGRALGAVVGMLMMMSTATTTDSEFRGFWVDGFNEGFHTPEQVDALLRRVRQANMNAIIVQMRKRGDAHYLSPLEPFATSQQAGFDALAYLIEKAHNDTPPIEVHVWLNCHPVWPGSSWPPDPKHILNRYPEIQTENINGERITPVGYGMDWGHPLSNEWFARVALDIVRRYDVDGIHFDYIRYTGEEWGYNPVSVARFNRIHNRTGKPEPRDPLWKQWRRNQVSAIVRKVYTQVMAIKPQVKVSGALITWGDGPKDTADWVNRSAYNNVFQDWRGWLEEGILDMAIPMVYYNQANPRHSEFYQNWIRFLKDHQYGRHGVVGVGNYLNTYENTLRQIDLALEPSAQGNRVVGVNFFSYAATSGNGTEEGARILYEEPFYQALNGRFERWLPTPPMPWKRIPTTGHLVGFLLYGKDLTPVDGATVDVYREGTLFRTATTDGTGYYALANLPEGTYRVVFRAEGIPTEVLESLRITAGIVSAHHRVMGESMAVRLNRLASLNDLPEGTRVFLVGKEVAEDCLEPKQTLIVRDPLSGTTASVNLSEFRLPWQRGDRVALIGTVRVLPNGTRQIDNAKAHWLGVQ